MKKHKILPVFIPFQGCNSKCIYCNQHAITGVSDEDLLLSVKSQIEHWRKTGVEWSEMAFYGGNFGNLPADIRHGMYKMADGLDIRYSTCPDSFSPDLENEIECFNVKTVEFGVQSLDENVLVLNGRYYDPPYIQSLFRRLRGRVKLCAQMMVGMYSEGPNELVLSAERLGNLQADLVRIYPTVVLKNTYLEKLFRSGEYIPLTPEETLLSAAWIYISAAATGSRVIRVGLPPDVENTGAVVGGFWHPAMGDLVLTIIMNSYFYNFGIEGTEGLNLTYGYKNLLKDRYNLNFGLRTGSWIATISKICTKLKESFIEGKQWFSERQNIEFACLIRDQAYV